MSDFLQQMAQSSAARAAATNKSVAKDALDRPAFPLQLDTFGVIAELKDRSPAEGALADASMNRADRARLYAEGGAAAISVLTEPDRFDGQLSHLAEVVDAVSGMEVPVMRKDFLVDTVQITEAKAAGASGVLLIAAMLNEGALASMLDCAFDHDLFVLLESFDPIDLDRSAQLLKSAKIREQAEKDKFLIGINSRNLRDLSVDPLLLNRLSASLPRGAVAVAESGQRTPADAAEVAGWGYGMTLVGTALMKSDAPSILIADMLVAGRNQVAA
jgi:indole-3-glycerol phosphate synthase